MKTLTLALMGPSGDQLAEIPVAAVEIAGPGEGDPLSEPLAIGSQMAELHQRVRETLDAAGAALAIDPLDLRVLVGRALLRQMDQDQILVPVPVLTPTPVTLPVTPMMPGTKSLDDKPGDLTPPTLPTPPMTPSLTQPMTSEMLPTPGMHDDTVNWEELFALNEGLNSPEEGG